VRDLVQQSRARAAFEGSDAGAREELAEASATERCERSCRVEVARGRLPQRVARDALADRERELDGEVVEAAALRSGHGWE